MAIVDFTGIRPLRGSRHEGFDELCCQLAGDESKPSDSMFISKQGAGGDAGVECYWTLPSGQEHGWQAKYFFTLGNKQWEQIDESVETALEKHPRLVRYVICLPIDLTDKREKKKKSQIEHWNTRVAKWKKWASSKGMSVAFERWGAHELRNKLMKPQHAGRIYYWFDSMHMTVEWQQQQLNETLKAVGQRYTPEINVKTSQTQIFDSICKIPRFLDQFFSIHDKIVEEWSVPPRISKIILTDQDAVELRTLFEKLKAEVPNMLLALRSISRQPEIEIQLEEISQQADALRSTSYQAYSQIEHFASKKTYSGEEPPKEKDDQRGILQKIIERTKSYKNTLWTLQGLLGDVITLAQSNYAWCSNQTCAVLFGSAGAGKTHLACDVAQERLDNNQPTIVLIGQQFFNSEPWQQIINKLGLTCKTAEEFLGAFDAAAQASKTRALVIIDAINEGEGRQLWKTHLPSMIEKISRFPRVKLVVTCRTSYRELIFTKSFEATLSLFWHQGFRDQEHIATQTFFDYYQIQTPSIPLLVPEFTNPLFLKLFCESLQRRHITTIPKGLRGITATFDFFVDSLHEKLSSDLEYDPKTNLVRNALNLLACEMAKQATHCLPRQQAKEIIDSVYPGNHRFTDTLFARLTSEGALSEDVTYKRSKSKNYETIDIVRFTYERFSDYEIVQSILNESPDLKDHRNLKEYIKTTPLQNCISIEQDGNRYGGWIEALSVLLPERADIELMDLFPHTCDWIIVKRSLLESILWRAANTFTSQTKRHFQTILDNGIPEFEEYNPLETLLLVTAETDNPFNAEFLHKMLSNIDMPQRDAHWTIYVSEQYETNHTVERLIEWGLTGNISTLTDECATLVGTTLSWFLTTPNRPIRDRSTKALVRIMQRRIPILEQLIKRFLTIDDPYVLERLLAVAYGCALRSAETQPLASLAHSFYQWFFKEDRLPVHFLARDYITGTIDTAQRKGGDLAFEVTETYPPYSSTWRETIPTIENLKRNHRTSYRLEGSVLGSGDFARYVIGTNYGRCNWTNRPIMGPHQLTLKEIHQNFLDGLSLEETEKWKKFTELCRNGDRFFRFDEKRRNEFFDPSVTEEDICSALKELNNEIRQSLGPENEVLLDQGVLEYEFLRTDTTQFDLRLIQSLVYQRILELGWTTELFGEFDSHIADPYRSSSKPERIGKKYQWIALHEVLACVADNFEYRSEGSERREIYEGPWQRTYGRDIDPSILITKTCRTTYDVPSSWWCTTCYDQWSEDDKKWIVSETDLPAIKDFVECTRPSDQTSWLNLDGFYLWKQPPPPGKKKYHKPYQDLNYILKSYFVKKKDKRKFLKWAKQQNFFGRWLPEAPEGSSCFLGEFPNSRAFQHYNNPYYSREGWTQKNSNTENLPVPVLVVVDNYYHERGYDCSIDETISISLPCCQLFNEMNLEWDGREGHYINKEGDLVAFDPSVFEKGPGALLFNKEFLLKHLEESAMEIVWILLGEKLVMQEDSVPRKDYLYPSTISGIAWLTPKSNFKEEIKLFPDQRAK